MRSGKTVWFIFLGLWLVQLLAVAATLVCVGMLDMLPTKYFLLLTAAGILLLGVTAALLFVRIDTSTRKRLRRWIAGVLVALTIIGCGFGIFVVTQLWDTIKNVTNGHPGTVMMAVYVRMDDPAQKLEDAADYRFASVTDYETEKTERTISHIAQSIGKTPATVAYDTVIGMIDALLAEQTDAIILNSAYVDILLDMDGYADIEQKMRVLCEVAVEAESDEIPSTEVTQPETEPAPPVEKTVTNSPFVVYISGSDSRSQTLRTSLSDVNILVVVNPVTKQVLLLNTPRDYYIPNPSGNGALDKLTHCGMYGVNCSISALESLYGIDVDYYARINFVGFEKMVDAIGGITVYADEDFNSSKYYFKKGENFLDGAKALAFARTRYTVTGGDNGRGRNQMKIITAMIDKLTSSPALITNYAGVMQSLQGLFVTSFSSEQISQFVKMQLNDMAQWDVLSYAVTGINGRDITYSMPGQKVSVMYMDQGLVDYASGLVSRMLAGETLTKEDVNKK